MKTPRQVLLDRHQGKQGHLDRLRRAALEAALDRPQAAETGADTEPGVGSLGILFWRQVIVPAWRVWLGLATVWLAILVLNLASRDASVSALARTHPGPPLSPGVMQAEKVWLRELAESMETGHGPQPVVSPPGPGARAGHG